MKKILLVIDMQNDFVTGPLSTPEARAIVPNIMKKINSKEYRYVVFTRDTHYSDYLNTFEGQRLPVEHCIVGTKGWEIIPEFNVDPHHSIIADKNTFGYDRIGEFLNPLLPAEIEVVGVCSDICIISNTLALRMFYPDMKITVDASCCAGVTPEKHRAALEVMKSCQIDVINDDE